MEALIRFPIFIAVSLCVFSAILWHVLRKRERQVSRHQVFYIGLIVVVGGMLFAKHGQNAGWPWWIYYTIPMLLTVLLPPLYFKMNRRETPLYLALSFLSAPVIHVVFSFFIGWSDYMPFMDIPAFWELG